MSAAPGGAPVAQRRAVLDPAAVDVRPPRRTPSAPAKAASHRPAFGLGCAAAVAAHDVSARETGLVLVTSGAQAAVSAAVTRAGTSWPTSSIRAAAQPNRRYRAERYPTIASRVLTAR